MTGPEAKAAMQAARARTVAAERELAAARRVWREQLFHPLAEVSYRLKAAWDEYRAADEAEQTLIWRPFA